VRLLLSFPVLVEQVSFVDGDEIDGRNLGGNEGAPTTTNCGWLG
jgi:hypothetical protein